MRRLRGSGLRVAAMAAAALLSACASTPGSIEAVTPVADRAALATYDTLVIEASATPTAQCTAADLDRIAQLTKAKLDELAPTRFRTVAVATSGQAPATGAAPYLNADLTLNTYERGSAAGRFMMAGVGQMRISGDLALSEQPGDRALGRYNVDKQFAWGGIYGAMTDMEDIEAAFAEATAKALLGEP